MLYRILENELAGVVRYTHYSLLVFGYGCVPIVWWLRTQAAEALLHAQQAGEMITHLGAHPSLAIGPLLESHQHDIAAILRESLEVEGDCDTLSIQSNTFRLEWPPCSGKYEEFPEGRFEPLMQWR